MDATRFLESVVRPVLHQLDKWSPAAEKLLIMTACHESGGFLHRTQVGGPAVSYFQIEPASFSDVWDRYLARRSDRFEKVVQFLPDNMEPLQALKEDDKFACAIARMKYAMIPEPLPHVTDNLGLALYCKTHWNTELGKATPEKYLDDFLRYAPDPMPEEWG